MVHLFGQLGKVVVKVVMTDTRLKSASVPILSLGVLLRKTPG
jgi:hypothetical protein